MRGPQQVDVVGWPATEVHDLRRRNYIGLQDLLGIGRGRELCGPFHRTTLDQVPIRGFVLGKTQVRRLAKQSRHDRVRSARDYQVLHTRQGVALRLEPRRTCRAVFTATIVKTGNVPYVGVGAYLKGDVPGDIRIRLVHQSGTTRMQVHHCQRQWGRFGMAVPMQPTGMARIEIATSGNLKTLHIWGLDCGALNLPEGVIAQGASTEEVLNSPQLAPETLYLPHEVAIAMDPAEHEWDGVHALDGKGAPISVKKCAYCQRLLPIDVNRPSALAFHKHNAKRTGHQNECRACKKWRINDSFNPKRTTDQLHESSVITRERKLFLREPEILQQIKDRQGAGLKSIIWRRFNKKCFRCNRPLKLSEVQLDHTRPLAYLWPIDGHATSLCPTCNNHKRERFPVDVYSEPQLRDLAAITGLPYEDLVRRELNDVELRRIVSGIATFAQRWDARTFNATARKIRELRPDVDLYEILGLADANLLMDLRERVRLRPSTEEELA